MDEVFADGAQHSQDTHPQSNDATLHELGTLCQNEGDLSAARLHYEESLQMERSIHGDRHHQGIASTLPELGRLCQAEGDLRAARRHYEESLQMKHSIH